MVQAGEFGIYSESQKTIAASVEEAEKAEATGQWDLKWQVSPWFFLSAEVPDCSHRPMERCLDPSVLRKWCSGPKRIILSSVR